jgi:hypothetical protein
VAVAEDPDGILVKAVMADLAVAVAAELLELINLLVLVAVAH